MGFSESLALLEYAKKDNSLISNHLVNGVHLLFSRLYIQNRNLIFELRKNKAVESKNSKLIRGLQLEMLCFLQAIEFYCVGSSDEEKAFYYGNKAFLADVYPAVKDKFLMQLINDSTVEQDHVKNIKILSSWIHGYKKQKLDLINKLEIKK
mgnify:CR=1 FL=1